MVGVYGLVTTRDEKMMSQLCSASIDNIRLWNAAEAGEGDGNVKSRGGVQFKIIPGHHGGYVSQMGKSVEAREKRAHVN